MLNIYKLLVKKSLNIFEIIFSPILTREMKLKQLIFKIYFLVAFFYAKCEVKLIVSM